MSAAKRKDPAELSIRLDPELHAAVTARAVAEDRTLSSLTRTALRIYLEGRPVVPEEEEIRLRIDAAGIRRLRRTGEEPYTFKLNDGRWLRIVLALEEAGP